MSFIIMILIGVGLTISNANGWFIVPDFCIYICFGVAGLIAIISIFNFFMAKHAINKNRKEMNKRFW